VTQLPPVPPGEVLRAEFMAPHGLTARALARDLGVPPNRVTKVLRGERAVTAATALLLARRFGTTAEFWMNLQTAHDLDLARRAMGEAA
jgi:antitoxin HigA-1